MYIEEYLQHAALKPGTTLGDIDALCCEAVEYKLTDICVPPLFVKKTKLLIEETDIKITTVIGFPFGYSAIEAKVAELVMAVIDGADEVEMVINTSAVKNCDWQFLANEINTVMPIIRGREKKITVIFETSLMTDEEIITACDIYGAAGVDYVKAGTGFTADGLIIERIKLIRKHLASVIQIKVATDIKNYSFAKDLVKAGANRLCCNNNLKLIQESLQQN